MLHEYKTMTALRSISKTPEDVSIQPRDPIFDLKAALATDWVDNDPFMTAVLNALSLSFPAGERNFIESIKHYERTIKDEKLLNEIRMFYKQEGIHSREHMKYNQLLCEQRGYDLKALEKVYIDHIKSVKNNPRVTPLMMLASTVAAEHFTATLGEKVLEGEFLENVEGPMGDLWRWHSLEEIEHKSIAFDVYTEVGGTYGLRAAVMRVTMWNIFIKVLKVAFTMLRQDKQLWKWKTLKSFSKFLFSKEGLVRVFAPSYKAFFAKDFHPWKVDNRELLDEWQNTLNETLVTR